MHKTKIVVLALTVALSFASLSTALAQYPPPAPGGPSAPASISITSSSGNPGTGSDVTLTSTVLDISGNPVAGATCTFVIVTQPGTDAYLHSTPATVETVITNAQGVCTAHLFTGSTPGTIVAAVNAGGTASQVVINVQGPPPAAAPAVAAAPPPLAALPVGIVPPRTGDAGLLQRDDGAKSGGFLTIVLIAGLVTSLALLAASRIAQRAR